jgi:hypothetical protein
VLAVNCMDREVRDFVRGNIAVLLGANEAKRISLPGRQVVGRSFKLESSENETGGNLLKHNGRSICLLTRIVILIPSGGF